MTNLEFQISYLHSENAYWEEISLCLFFIKIQYLSLKLAASDEWLSVWSLLGSIVVERSSIEGRRKSSKSFGGLEAIDLLLTGNLLLLIWFKLPDLSLGIKREPLNSLLELRGGGIAMWFSWMMERLAGVFSSMRLAWWSLRSRFLIRAGLEFWFLEELSRLLLLTKDWLPLLFDNAALLAARKPGIFELELDLEALECNTVVSQEFLDPDLGLAFEISWTNSDRSLWGLFAKLSSILSWSRLKLRLDLLFGGRRT